MQAVKHGFAGLLVGCEPTGHRWRSVMQLADDAGAGFVCVQSLKVHLAREADDYTRDKTDHKDAVLIGKLISRLDCYLPERAMRTGPGCGIWGSAGSGWSVSNGHVPQPDQRPAVVQLARRIGVRGQAARVHRTPDIATEWLQGHRWDLVL